MPESVQFQRGTSSKMPTQIVPGTFSIQEDTGNMYLDITNTESVDERIQIKDSTKLPLDGSVAMTGNLDMGNFSITNLAQAVNNGDAVNLQVLNQIISENKVFLPCPADLNSITKGGIYYNTYNTSIIYTPLPEGTTSLSYLIHSIVSAEESGTTQKQIQLGYFGNTEGQYGWYHREQDTDWTEWIGSFGGGISFSECPQDLVTISENGIYYPFLTQTFSNGPENSLKPLVIIATKNPADNSTINLIGAFIMQDATYQWFTIEYVLNTTTTYTWHEFVGTGGGGGTTGDLPPGGSPDTILIGTEVSGQGAWTTTLPPAVIIDDGSID